MKRQVIVFLTFTFIFITNCSSYPNKNPIGKKFPSVKGESLAKQEWSIPEDMQGKPVLLLLGYKQQSQFDIDRWLIGIDMTKTKIKVFELPAVKGLIPQMIKPRINEGMRRGIPDELWAIVITIYGDGDTVQKFTGNEKPNNARVILLDQTGTIRYFTDRGFSVSGLNKLREMVDKLKEVK
ncbi:MAG: hypothetical protein AAF518_15190 [Spirochaetota bacterium]